MFFLHSACMVVVSHFRLVQGPYRKLLQYRFYFLSTFTVHTSSNLRGPARERPLTIFRPLSSSREYMDKRYRLIAIPNMINAMVIQSLVQYRKRGLSLLQEQLCFQLRKNVLCFGCWLKRHISCGISHRIFQLATTVQKVLIVLFQFCW